MPIDTETLKTLIAKEISSISDSRVVTHIRGMLVEPYVVLHDWDYGEPGQQYPCWMVLEDPRSRAEIAYCEYGFGPRCPWGLVGPVSRTGRNIGMDSAWYTIFLDAFFESFASIELPIWRVFRIGPDRIRTPITEEGTWEATWARVYYLRNSDPAGRYDCEHSIAYGR